jgi:hypothetical protein
MAAKEAEWVQLAILGNFLQQLNPAFDPRSFGHKQLQSLIRDYPGTFALKHDKTKTPPIVYVGFATQKESQLTD